MRMFYSGWDFISGLFHPIWGAPTLAEVGGRWRNIQIPNANQTRKKTMPFRKTFCHRAGDFFTGGVYFWDVFGLFGPRLRRRRLSMANRHRIQHKSDAGNIYPRKNKFRHWVECCLPGWGFIFSCFWPIWGPPALAKVGSRWRWTNTQRRSDAENNFFFRFREHFSLC